MDDENIFLSSKFRRRVFYLSSSAALVALVGVRFFILPNFLHQTILPLAEIINQVIDALLVSLVASLAITSLIIWLSPPAAAANQVEVVPSYSIQETIDSALIKTDEWWYRGHSGRHFRSSTLPRLARDARRENLSKKIVIQILDPTDDKVCEYYARYRQRLRTAITDREWTPERVSAELYATIASCMAWRESEPALDFTIALISTISLFRIDLSSRLGIVTKEDPKEPALRFNEGGFFYQSYREDLFMTLQQSQILPRDVIGIRLPALNHDSLKKMLVALGIDSPRCTQEFLHEVVELTKKAQNPYA